VQERGEYVVVVRVDDHHIDHHIDVHAIQATGRGGAAEARAHDRDPGPSLVALPYHRWAPHKLERRRPGTSEARVPGAAASRSIVAPSGLQNGVAQSGLQGDVARADGPPGDTAPSATPPRQRQRAVSDNAPSATTEQRAPPWALRLPRRVGPLDVAEAQPKGGPALRARLEGTAVAVAGRHQPGIEPDQVPAGAARDIVVLPAAPAPALLLRHTTSIAPAAWRAGTLAPAPWRVQTLKECLMEVDAQRGGCCPSVNCPSVSCASPSCASGPLPSVVLSSCQMSVW